MSGDPASMVRTLAAWRVRHGLTGHQAEVLLLVHDAGAVTSATLSRDLGLTTASMARLVALLVGQEWIHRVPDGRDARQILLQPTKRLVRACAELETGGGLAATEGQFAPEAM